MLDITEVESGTGDFKTEQIDLVKIIRSVFELYQPLADEKGIRMVIHLPETLMLKGVRQNIQRLVANLLENAIKYTPSGGAIKISSFIVDSTIRMIIEDTGFGIPESELPKIFDRFYRSDRSRTEPGIGLGLSLAKAIANAHGGDITAKSVINQGSSFIVTLPAGVKKSDTICQEIKD
jgi:signal transduction histidine kinase